ncbi:hypothetical protein PMI16_04830 [Herbaspirillum sp. CF444]|nr:hypothetical protein PMI16_04830 [Herbaspirillum sp. CF444]
MVYAIDFRIELEPCTQKLRPKSYSMQHKEKSKSQSCLVLEQCFSLSDYQMTYLSISSFKAVERLKLISLY